MLNGSPCIKSMVFKTSGEEKILGRTMKLLVIFNFQFRVLYFFPKQDKSLEQ